MLPSYASPFEAQFIAQEVMPLEPREEPGFGAAGIAAYATAAARMETVLGPTQSLSRVV